MRATKPAKRQCYDRLPSYPLRQWRAVVAILMLTAALSGMAALPPWPLKILIDCALSGAALPPSLDSLLSALSLKTIPQSKIQSLSPRRRGSKIQNGMLPVALVLQDPFLLPLSVAENIAYSRPGASREEIVAR
jgi:ABC-type multidrug transport system fused ATPase/permease subunit